MKVIHCLNHFLPDHIAGTEVYTLSLIKALTSRKVDSIVVIPNYHNNMTEEYELENIRVIKYGEPSVVDRDLIMGRRIPEGTQSFKEILHTEKPDIVQFHELAGSNGLTLHHVKAAKAIGFRTVMTFHVAKYSCKTGTLMYKNETFCDGIIDRRRCSECWVSDKLKINMLAKSVSAASSVLEKINCDTRSWNTSLGTALGSHFIINELRKDLNELVDNCDAVVVLSNWYKNVLERNNIGQGKTSLITQGLPEGESSSVNENEQNGEKLKLVFVGRISHFKGVLLLIEAVKSFASSKISLYIYGQVGSDNYSIRCKDVSASSDNIYWMGTLQPQKVVSTLANFDILCVPSEVCEMSPLVIQEAFAAGIPVIASDVYGNNEQIKDGSNGWLFKYKSLEHLKQKLSELLSSPGKVKAAKNNILPVKTFDEVAEEYVSLYNTVLAQQ